MHSASRTRDHLFVPSRSPIEAMCTTSGLNNYTKHLDEHGPISFCFYYTPEFHRKHETTRQKSVTLDYSQTRRLFNSSYRHNTYIH